MQPDLAHQFGQARRISFQAGFPVFQGRLSPFAKRSKLGQSADKTWIFRRP